MLSRALSKAEVLAPVERRLQCASTATCLEMKRGLSALSTIATTAPLAGLFGTVIGLLNAFRGCGSERWACFTAIIDGLCEALITTLLGLLVAIPAAWFYNYFTDRLELFSIEMSLASSELLTYLTVHGGRPASHGSDSTNFTPLALFIP